MGSQRQRSGRTVQEDLETALSRLSGRHQDVVLAGRTDSGVHAIGQVASIADVRPEMSDNELIRAINAHLDDDLAVVACERMSRSFHARYDARWREYRYRIWWGVPQPLQRLRAWQRWPDLDIAAMNVAASLLLGKTDLASFAGNGKGVEWGHPGGERGTVRSVRLCTVYPVSGWWGTAPADGSGCEIRIVADGFLPQAVRTIASALAEVGRGKRSPAWITELVAARDRRKGPQTAPPHGLILWRVGYGDDVPAPDPTGEQLDRESVAILDLG